MPGLTSWGVHPLLARYGDELINLAGSEVRVTSGYRSQVQQARLYRRYLLLRDREPVFPALPPGYSMHQYGRAWDMEGSSSVLEALGRVWESWGGRWGGPSDPIHFEA